MSVIFAVTKIHVYKYKKNSIISQRSNVQFLEKESKKSDLLSQKFKADQVLGTLRVFNFGSLFFNLACKIISLNYRTITLCGRETVRCTEWQCVRSGC